MRFFTRLQEHRLSLNKSNSVFYSTISLHIFVRPIFSFIRCFWTVEDAGPYRHIFHYTLFPCLLFSHRLTSIEPRLSRGFPLTKISPDAKRRVSCKYLTFNYFKLVTFNRNHKSYDRCKMLFVFIKFSYFVYAIYIIGNHYTCISFF